MLLAMTGVEVWHGVKPDSFGIKLVLTIPKVESKRIDDLLFTDYTAWTGEVCKLFKAGYEFAKRWFGEGVGGVASLDYTGESNLVEPHYHINLYVFPCRKVGKKWEVIPRWADAGKLNDMRKSWTARVNELYGTAVPVADFQIGYLGKAGKLRHWLNYLYRPSLSDLWKGWRGFDGDLVTYEYGKAGKKTESYIPADDLQKAFERLEWIPSKWKRIRWWGIFSDGQRAKTMESLGLEGEDVDGDDDSDGEWKPDKRAYFVHYQRDGVRLADAEALGDDSCVWHEPDKSELTALFDSLTPEQCSELDRKGELDLGDGTVIIQDIITEPEAFERAGRHPGAKYHTWQHVQDDDGAMVYECRKCGRREYSVPDSLVDYRPGKVAIGKRKRWREPGG
jgi:hypothetical protein